MSDRGGSRQDRQPLRNINAYIMPCDEASIVDSALCPGEIILGNPFFAYSAHNVTEFIADNIEFLSSRGYSNLHEDTASTKTSGSLACTAMPSLRRLRFVLWDSPVLLYVSAL